MTNKTQLLAPDFDKVRALANFANAEAARANHARGYLADFLSLLALRHGIPDPVAVTPMGELIHIDADGTGGVATPSEGSPTGA